MPCTQGMYRRFIFRRSLQIKNENSPDLLLTTEKHGVILYIQYIYSMFELR